MIIPYIDRFVKTCPFGVSVVYILSEAMRMEKHGENALVFLDQDARVTALLKANRAAGEEGLALSHGQMLSLMRAEERALLDTGRVEFGVGALPEIVRAFADSPCIADGEYAAVLEEITVLFYELKNEIEGALTDDELIDTLARVFNGRAQGSVEYLRDLSPDDLYAMANGTYRED